MASETETVTLRDIALLAGGVTAPAVANWRKRFDDFPQPIDKEGRQPLFNREDVIAAYRQRKSRRPNQHRRLASRSRRKPPAPNLRPRRRNSARLDAQRPRLRVRHNPRARPIQRRNQATPHPVHPKRSPHRRHRSARSLRRPPLRRIPRTKNFSALIATISETPENAVLYDPCAGLGSTLAAAATSTSALHGQELVPEIAAAARQLLASRNLHANIVEGDTIREDKLANVIADRVFATPPLNMRLDEDAVNDNDPRWTLRTPKKYDSDVAFIQIALAHLAPTGRAIVHTSLSVLYRTNSILETIVGNNQLDAVITLPAGVAPEPTSKAAYSSLTINDQQTRSNDKRRS